MDARERYGPEDLEALLSERAFDELLAEERAFVLRHVTDRNEYDALRATLARVRANGRPGPAVEARPEVRAGVLAAFREARRPAWRIWLNSVGTWLAPPRPALYWRPVVAFGTLALLIAAGVALWMPGAGLRKEGTAELHSLPPAPKKEAPPAEPANTEQQPTGASAVTGTAPKTADAASSIHQASVEGPALDGPPPPPATSAASRFAAADANTDLPTERASPDGPVAGTVPPAEGSIVVLEEVAAAKAERMDAGDAAAPARTAVPKAAKGSRAGAGGAGAEASASLAGANADLRGLLRAAW